MSSTNPEGALAALAGKVYEFRGTQIRNTNAAMFALEVCGVRLEEIHKRLAVAAPIAIWAMAAPLDAVIPLLGSAEKIRSEALRFCAQMSAEDMGEATAILIDCLKRYNESVAVYASKHGDSGNRQAA